MKIPDKLDEIPENENKFMRIQSILRLELPRLPHNLRIVLLMFAYHYSIGNVEQRNYAHQISTIPQLAPVLNALPAEYIVNEPAAPSKKSFQYLLQSAIKHHIRAFLKAKLTPEIAAQYNAILNYPLMAKW